MDCDNRLSDWESHTKFHLRENRSKVTKQYKVGDASCKIISLMIKYLFDDICLYMLCLRINLKNIQAAHAAQYQKYK